MRRKLSQKLEELKQYVNHPVYQVGLDIVDDLIEEAKQLEIENEKRN